jgi:hypothetical protein
MPPKLNVLVRGACAQLRCFLLLQVRRTHLDVGDQRIPERVGAERVDALERHAAEHLGDRALHAVGGLAQRARVGARVEIEIDLGELRHPEFGEQVVQRRAVGVEDDAGQGADTLVLERRVNLERQVLRMRMLRMSWIVCTWLSWPNARMPCTSSAMMVSSICTCGTVRLRILRLSFATDTPGRRAPRG